MLNFLVNLLHYVLQTKVNDRKFEFDKFKKNTFFLFQGLQALIPVILHLLLSSSFALLSTKTDEQKQLLSTINQLLENIFSITIDKNILYSTMITIINFRSNCKKTFQYYKRMIYYNYFCLFF